jgi:hypothetical protein
MPSLFAGGGEDHVHILALDGYRVPNLKRLASAATNHLRFPCPLR